MSNLVYKIRFHGDETFWHPRSGGTTAGKIYTHKSRAMRVRDMLAVWWGVEIVEYALVELPKEQAP